MRSRVSLYTGLMVFSVVTAMLPLRWTAWTGRVMQPVAWAQSLGRMFTRHSVELVEGQVLDGRSVPLSEYLTLQERVEDLERQVRHQRLSLQALSERTDALTALRGQLRDASARIVLARVLGSDASPDRETLTISVGLLKGIAVGDWVVAGQRIPDEDATGRELIWRQWLIGRVAEVHPHVSRVKLATDRTFGPIEVALARPAPDGSLGLADDPAVLEGLGGGRMVIRQATEDFRESGYRYAVVHLPAAVPLVLSIGEISDTRKRQDSSLHYDLELRPPGRLTRRSWVYVLRFE